MVNDIYLTKNIIKGHRKWTLIMFRVTSNDDDDDDDDVESDSGKAI